MIAIPICICCCLGVGIGAAARGSNRATSANLAAPTVPPPAYDQQPPPSVAYPAGHYDAEKSPQQDH